jgi:hypothetical protein
VRCRSCKRRVTVTGIAEGESMRILFAILALSVVSFSSSTATLGADEPPAWAYPVNPPDFKPRPEDGILRRIPGSNAAYSVTPSLPICRYSSRQSSSSSSISKRPSRLASPFRSLCCFERIGSSSDGRKPSSDARIELISPTT